MRYRFQLGKHIGAVVNYRKWGFFFLLLLFSACAPLITATPPPTPQVLTLTRPLALTGWDARIHDCAKNFPQLAIFILEDSVGSSNQGFTLYLGNPPQPTDFTYIIGYEDILVLANKAFPFNELSLTQLQDLLSTGLPSPSIQDPSIPAVQFWTYPSDDEARIAFDQAALNAGSAHIQAQIAPDPSAMLEALANDPAAFGYLPVSFFHANPDQQSQVKLLDLDGTLADALRQPVLAIFTSNPDALENAYLRCLKDADHSSTTSSP